MSFFAITLLVVLTLYAIYFYDKHYNNSERQLVIKKYLKKQKIASTKTDTKAPSADTQASSA